MRESPSIVPWGTLARDVYLVLDDFGERLGRSWCETDEADTDRATLIRHLLEGQYSSPVCVVADCGFHRRPHAEPSALIGKPPPNPPGFHGYHVRKYCAL